MDLQTVRGQCDGSPYWCDFSTGISSHNSKLTPICLLHIEKIAIAVMSCLFKMAFSAPLLC